MKDIGLLIIISFIVGFVGGFVGERYKDVQIWAYACFIGLLFSAVEFYYYLTVGSIMFGDLNCNLCYLVGLLVIVGNFYLQKRLRCKKDR